MVTYRVKPITHGSSWKIHGWRVEKKRLFGALLMGKFTERQAAVDFAKKLGDSHRPAHIKIYDSKGNLNFSFSYSDRPRIQQ